MRSLVVAALVLAALIGASAAADAHCEVTYNTYTDKACTAGEVKLGFSKQQGTVKDTCVKTGLTTNKGSKMATCTSTSYTYQEYTDETCTTANKVGTVTSKTLSDTTCTQVSGSTTKWYKYTWVAKAEGAQAVLGAASTLLATAMLVTQV